MSNLSIEQDSAHIQPADITVRVVRQQLKLLPLVAILFFTVSGGAYGLEDLVGYSGPGMALLLILVTPLIWSLPTALMVAELSTAMPVQGGYYAWVKRALGPFWGFLEGWWSWSTSFVDMAIYPVLFADYLSTLLVQQFDFHLIEENELAHWGVTLVIIWVFSYLNIRGAKSIGDSSNLFGLFILAPFAVMAIIGIIQLILNPTPIWEPFIPPDTTVLGAFGVGLFVVMWNYLGWDGVSTVAGEMENPKRNYPRALVITLPLVTLAYLLPVVGGLAASPDWAGWTAGYFPEVAAALAGPWLGAWLAIGGLISAVGLFSAIMMSISRVPFVMAEDGYLPKAITKLHPTYGTPFVAIIVCAIIYSIFTLSAFASLVVVDVILYSCALMLEFAALVALRIREPNMKRPVRVPGGWLGLILVCLLPAGVVTLAIVSTIQEEGIEALYLSMAAIAIGPILYPFLRKFVKKDQPDVPVEIEYEETRAAVLNV
ncbi:MAG: APC family permease [Anaerolineae bacterium]